MATKLPDRQIVHLHAHSEYSLMDAVKNSSEFLKAAKEKGLDSFSFTEHGNMASTMGFYLEAIKPEVGIKPIFGLEAYIVDDITEKTKEAKSSHIVLVARTDLGFKNLLRLSNISWNEGFYYKPRIDFKSLQDHAKGLTALTACMGGVVSNVIRYKDYDAARKRVLRLKKIFGENLFLEMQLMEEVYGPDLERVERKIKMMKDENLSKEKLEFLEQNKNDYVKLLEEHMETDIIIPEYEIKMKELIGDSWVDQATVNKYMLKLSKETGVDYIITGDCHYPRKGDHKLQDLIIRVGFGNYKKARQGADDKSSSSGRGYYSSQLYVKNNKDLDDARKKWHPYMKKKVLIHAIENTHKIADQVKTNIPIGQHQLPVFPLETNPKYVKGMTKEELFHKCVYEGFEKNVRTRIKKEDVKAYHARLKFEIDTIKAAHFIDYFLIIEDIVRWSRENNIYCIARGSVAGSLAAYALSITNIDPIPYNLLFERFLNPTRVSGERAKSADALPDIDLDFERMGRGKVKNYIVEKYGKDRVLTIGAYGTMGLKTLIKDFSRVLDYKIGGNEYDYGVINKITSGLGMTTKDIEEACAESKDFADFYEKNKGWFETYIRPLIGNIKSMSKHAAGVLITPTKFTDWVPVRTQLLEEEGEDGEEAKVVIAQWEDVYCERRGLLKLDILGVKQLDVLHRCLDLIRKNHKLEISLDDIDVNDKTVYKRFHIGDNFGVFQFNSNTQSGYTRKLKPNNIEDLCASNALIRPGPMAQNAHEDFIKIRNGKLDPEYDHECIKKYVENTGALLVYQEQIMQVSHELGGLSLAEADMMRSAIKKKDEKLMTPFYSKFIEGCKSKGLTSKHADKVWKKILDFSTYSFNKSHSATYALQGYQCQWLKVYFPNEFCAATMEFADDSLDKNENIYTHRIHAIEEGIKMYNPSALKATTHFSINKKTGGIYWPLRAVKGVGGKAALEIQKIQPFSSLEDFMERVNKRIVNKRVMTKLIQAEAFKRFGKTEDIMRNYFKIKKEKYPEELDNLRHSDWKKKKDETLGYISQSYKQVFKDFYSDKIMSKEEFKVLGRKKFAVIGGIITKMREYKARNGKMGFLTIEDLDEKYEIVIFASVWDRLKNKPFKGDIVEIRGTKDKSPRGEDQVALGNPTRDKIIVMKK